jgi:hypothetical protein
MMYNVVLFFINENHENFIVIYLNIHFQCLYLIYSKHIYKTQLF